MQPPSDMPVPCAACESPRTRLFGARRGWRYLECLNCGSLQLDPMPDAETLARAYRDEYSRAGHYAGTPETRNTAARRVFQGIADAYAAHAPAGAAEPVLDYGCGWGGLLDELRARGIPCEGADLSRDMAAHTRAQGHPVQEAALEDIGGEARCAGIVMAAVFEHLTDHAATLEAARRLLVPGGLLVTFMPTARFARFFGKLARLGLLRLPLPELHGTLAPPWHTLLISASGLRALAGRHGFDIVDLRPGPVQAGNPANETLHHLNRLGWPLLGERWPLCPCHLFVLRKR